MLSAPALEMGRLYYECAHAEFFSAHASGGHGCSCSLCLRECACAACVLQLMWRLIGGAK